MSDGEAARRIVAAVLAARRRRVRPIATPAILADASPRPDGPNPQR